MLILHDPATLAHKTVELLGAKIIPALESPERISTILEAIHASHAHQIKIIDSEHDAAFRSEDFLNILSSTHNAGYLHHLSHAHSSWVKEGLIEQHESILPECFPFSTSANARDGDCHLSSPDPPRDIFARAGFYAFDLSTGICASTYTSALASAHLAFAGVRTLFDASSSQPTPPRPYFSRRPATILALCRPPGHHCDTRRAGGYCYLNNAVIAVAAFRLLQHHPSSINAKQPLPLPSLLTTTTYDDPLATSSTPPSSSLPSPPRIAILDLDFHHGNGTQEAFYADPHVLYISIHGQDEYPYYTGAASETGTGPAIRTNLNLPLPAGSSVEQYMTNLDIGLTALVAFKPDFVVLSLGFDTFHLDPLGSFGIDTDDYTTIARRVVQSLEGLDSGDNKGEGHSAREGPVRCLILLEGGYVIEKLGPNLLSFLRGWEGSVS